MEEPHFDVVEKKILILVGEGMSFVTFKGIVTKCIR